MPKKILIADDDKFVKILYQQPLTRAGYNVVVAQDAQSALTLCKKARPDLVLLDLVMPEFDGFRLLGAMKDDPQLANIPVAVLTNLSQASDEKAVRELGAIDYIVKVDLGPSELVTRVKTLLGDN